MNFYLQWLPQSQHIQVRLREGWVLTIHLFDKQKQKLIY